MATGSGKTVVMAMLIAWQTLNKVAVAATTPASPTGSSSSRPGITIRDRLRVLLPERRRELLPTCATSSRPTSRAASSKRAS